MATSTFYSQPQSELGIRSNITLKYFSKWAQQIASKIQAGNLEEKFAFVDLCAGFGVEEQEEFISSKLLQIALKNRALRKSLTTIINDKDETSIARLTGNLAQLDLVETLHFLPNINYSEVDDNVKTTLSTINTLPTFVLLDFWNYSGISIELMQQLVLKSGADCLLHFDYQNICRSISKAKEQENLIRVFGPTLTTTLQNAFKKRLSAYQKEQLIIQAFFKRIQEMFGTEIPTPLQYKFYNHKNKTSHFIFFLTQNKSAYSLMREVFSAESQVIEDGIGNLEFNPNKGLQQKIRSQTLFGSMFHLEQELLQTYKSQTLQLIDIYENHNWGRPLIKKNYIDALLNLEKKNKITVTRKRRSHLNFNPSNTLGDKVFVSFNK